MSPSNYLYMKPGLKLSLIISAAILVFALSCAEKENCAKCQLIIVCEGERFDDGSGARNMSRSDIKNLIDNGRCTKN